MYNSDGSLVAGQVYDIVVTYDNNTASIYINGVNSGTRRLNSPIAGPANNVTIGYGSGLPYGNCSMYAFRRTTYHYSQMRFYRITIVIVGDMFLNAENQDLVGRQLW